tara:strand:- start:50 stop:394 length:345 start_codon:yes stop_codon:yes gene_type:complete
MSGLESLGKKGVSTVGNIIGAHQRKIELFLVGIIVIEYIPHDILGIRFKTLLRPFMDPVKKLIKHPVMHLFLFVCLLYSCCIKRDMNLFLLLTIFMMTYRIHDEIAEGYRSTRQ